MVPQVRVLLEGLVEALIDGLDVLILYIVLTQQVVI